VICLLALSCCRVCACCHGQEAVSHEGRDSADPTLLPPARPAMVWPVPGCRHSRSLLTKASASGQIVLHGRHGRAYQAIAAPPELARGAPAARPGWNLLLAWGGGPGLAAMWRGPARVLIQPASPGVGASGLALDRPFQVAHRRLISADPPVGFSSGPANAWKAVSTSCDAPRAQGRAPGPTATVSVPPPQRPPGANRSTARKPSQQRPMPTPSPSVGAGRCARRHRDMSRADTRKGG